MLLSRLSWFKAACKRVSGVPAECTVESVCLLSCVCDTKVRAGTARVRGVRGRARCVVSLSARANAGEQEHKGAA